MPSPQVILITGVTDYWGGRVAARLARNPDLRVLGVDSHVPRHKIEGLDFIQTDIRNPLLVALLKAEQVDTVIHLTFNERRRTSEADFDLNVMGTMKVFGACREAGVRKIVWRSSMDVYGAHPDNPAFLPETWPLRGSRAYGHTRYRIEVEEFAQGFGMQFAAEMVVTTLRFANIIGPTAVTPLTKLLSQNVTPTLMGFNPLLQLIHEDDVVEALCHAVFTDAPGVFNIGTDDPQPLLRLLRLAHNIELPILHPLAYWGSAVLRGTPFKPEAYFPLDLDYLRYRWVGDTRKMQESFGFVPQYTAVDSLTEFVRLKKGQPIARRFLEADYLSQIIDFRQQKNQPQTQAENQATNKVTKTEDGEGMQ
jgi:UDP-glucose 4-epimerase